MADLALVEGCRAQDDSSEPTKNDSLRITFTWRLMPLRVLRQLRRESLSLHGNEHQT